MNNLQIFKNQEFGEIRAIDINNAPYFVAKDVCEILDIKNTTDAVKRLDSDEVTRLNLGGLSGETNLVNEYGLYTLILGSRKKEAKQFKRWITHEVIPAIRKTGGYIAGEENMTEDELVLKAIQVMQKKVKVLEEKTEKLATENSMQFQLIGELQPKADYLDKILKSKSIVPISYIAKDYGMTAYALNKKLHELGVQYKIGDTWLLYRKYQSFGYTHGKITEFYRTDGTLDTKTTMEWTQKGRLFLYELLKANNIVPVIEK